MQALDQAQKAQSDFLVIGIVGAVGSGTSWIAQVLKRLLVRRRADAKIINTRDSVKRAAPAVIVSATDLKAARPIDAATGEEPDPADVQRFIDRDQDDPTRKHGQHVAATFELADYFVDTSAQPFARDVADTELDAWPVTAELGRFLDLIRGERRTIRPAYRRCRHR